MISVEALHVPPAPSSHVFLLICGFITEDDGKAESWDGLLALLAATHGDDAVYAVQWPADSLSSLIAVGSLAALGAALVGSALAECFTPEEKKDSKGAKIAKTGAGAASAVVGFGAAAAYKFSAAQGRAERCAVELAGLLNAFACEGRHVTLVGHSLGGRMILHALKHAHDCGIDVDVQDVVLMGAACNGASGTWMGGLSLVRGLVVNLHNANDGLLSECVPNGDWGGSTLPLLRVVWDRVTVLTFVPCVQSVPADIGRVLCCRRARPPSCL